GDRDEIHRAAFQPALFRSRHGVSDAGMRLRCRNLLRARVRADDGLEALGQIERRLAAATGTVPGPLSRWGDLQQKVEQRTRIARAKFRVLSGEARKMILECHREVPSARGVPRPLCRGFEIPDCERYPTPEPEARADFPKVTS